LKRGWMRSWRSGSLVLAAILTSHSLASPPAGQSSAAVHRANELTLAGLRPGKDTVGRAISKYKSPSVGAPGDTSFSWPDFCRKRLLSIEAGPEKKIQTVRLQFVDWLADCVKVSPSKWKTGRGLAIQDPSARVIQLYGQPDSRNASTRGLQAIELLHYTFDWAGPDVPQIMEVLCTQDKDGEPGRVLEITLRVPTL
jgi:hypothetical protein